MNGDPEAIVADIWIIRAFDVDKQYPYKGRLASRSPSMKTYDAIEWYFRWMAPVLGLEPREACSMTWGGVRGEVNSDTTRYDDIVAFRLSGLFEDTSI